MNNKFILGIIFTFLIAACQPKTSTDLERLVLKDVNVIDVAGAGTLSTANIVIEGEWIVSIDMSSTYKRRPNDTVLELADHYVIPGLINGHIHFAQADDPDTIYPKLLSEGVTGLRDLGGPSAPMRAFSAAGDAAPGTRPDVYFSGSLAGPAFRDDPRIAPLIEENSGEDPEGIWFVENETDIEPFIKAAKASGAHGLKLYTALNAAQLESITRTAESHNLKVWTHAVIFPANSTDVINSKPTEIIHTKGLIAAEADNLPAVFMAGVRGWIPKQDFDLATLDTPRYQSVFAQMAAADIALNPALIADGDVAMESRTLPPWMSDFRDWACAATERAQKAGVSITAGTDYDGGPGLLQKELNRLTECGLTPLQALRAATVHNAEVLGVEDEVGRIAEGYRADIVVLRTNPADTLDALKDIHVVIKDGVLVEPGFGE